MGNQQIIKEQPKFLKASDVSSILGVSETTSYRIIKKLNDELKQQGFITVPGKISKRIFEEKVAL